MPDVQDAGAIGLTEVCSPGSQSDQGFITNTIKKDSRAKCRRMPLSEHIQEGLVEAKNLSCALKREGG